MRVREETVHAGRDFNRLDTGAAGRFFDDAFLEICVGVGILRG